MAKDSVTIRDAGKQDAGKLAGLMNELGRSLGGSGRAMTTERVLRDILNPDRALGVLVAKTDSGLVGYVMHQPSYETLEGAPGRYILDLYVQEQARRRGIATRLLSAVARLTSAEGGEYIWWITKGDTEVARRLYDGLANIRENVTAYAATHKHFVRLADLQNGDENGL